MHDDTTTDTQSEQPTESTDDGATVTPYEGEGTVDYDRLLDQFGTDRLTDEQVRRFPDHPMVRRRVFYAGRDVDRYLTAAEADEPHSIVTGVGPSGPLHLGHALVFYFARRLQAETGAHVRVCRDVARKERFAVDKPGALLGKFLPALDGPGKMSASSAAPAIATDDRGTVREKIVQYTHSGGRVDVEDHRERGGDPSVDVAYQYLHAFFERDDGRVEQLAADYRAGTCSRANSKRPPPSASTSSRPNTASDATRWETYGPNWRRIDSPSRNVM